MLKGNWKKVILLVMVFAAVSVMLTGCGGSEPKSPPKEQTATQEGAPAAVEYPTKAITMVIPWSAGGGTDLIGRQIAALMEKDLGQPVVVVNKVGGGGSVGQKEVQMAKPDGYTICLTSFSQILQKYSSPDSYVDYKTMKPIALVNEDPAALTVNAKAPWNTLAEFVEYAKNNPGEIRISNSGTNAVWHIGAVKLENIIGTKFTHVPYEGGNPAAVAVAGGEVEATFVSPAEVAALVQAGQLKILAIPTEQRDPNYPDVPTFKEEGIDLVYGTWRAFVAPKDTPDEIINILATSIEKIYYSDEYQEFLKKGGYGPMFKGTQEFSDYMDQQDKEVEQLMKQITEAAQ